LNIYAEERKRKISEECTSCKLQDTKTRMPKTQIRMILSEKVFNSVPSTKRPLKTGGKAKLS